MYSMWHEESMGDLHAVRDDIHDSHLVACKIVFMKEKPRVDSC